MNAETAGARRMAVILSTTLIVAGCSMTGNPQPKAGTVRSSGETAPADLQLICASEAASRFNISGGVLPVSSMPGPGGSYQVNLTMDGGQAVCFIGEDGIVLEVSDGTPMGHDLDFYRRIPNVPAPYGQALVMLLLVETLSGLKKMEDLSRARVARAE